MDEVAARRRNCWAQPRTPRQCPPRVAVGGHELLQQAMHRTRRLGDLWCLSAFAAEFSQKVARQTEMIVAQGTNKQIERDGTDETAFFQKVLDPIPFTGDDGGALVHLRRVDDLLVRNPVSHLGTIREFLNLLSARWTSVGRSYHPLHDAVPVVSVGTPLRFPNSYRRLCRHYLHADYTLLRDQRNRLKRLNKGR